MSEKTVPLKKEETLTLEQKIEQAKAQREQHLAQANMFAGYISALEEVRQEKDETKA